MDFQEAGPSSFTIMSRNEIFNIMQRNGNLNINEKLEYVENYLLSRENYSESENKYIRRTFSYVKSEIKRRWMLAHKKEDIFLKKNQEWLSGSFKIPKKAFRSGRPCKSFCELSIRSKRRKTQELRNTVNSDELMFAAQLKLQTSGKRDASKILKEITSSPSRANKYKKVYSTKPDENKTQLSIIQALSMYVEAGLSRNQYNIIRETNKSYYPCYSVIQKAKLDCYPCKDSFTVTATCAEVNLQELMNHTSLRLLTYLQEVVQTLGDSDRETLMLISKWGCDGSQQSQYKQKFETESDSDANIFQSSFVPLQLICGINKRVLWQNPTPSSPRYCRPIRIRFVKESVDITNEEICYVQNAIDGLYETKVTLDSKLLSVTHTMMFTMVDGKVCNAATHNTSTMKCYICGATSKDFNDLTKKKEINQDALKFGLSILHTRIRIFENLLHLSYKLPIKKWQLRLETDKQLVKQRKLNIQQEFRRKLGLIVDIPKAGFGNTNDGNTSRRFFLNPDTAAQITGLDSSLIYRFKVLLEVISSGYKIDIEKFEKYTMDTAKMYVEMYPWYPMSPTMHKLLVHGPTVIKNALLPIGQLSEEAAEARNKHFRLYRENYARKCSREACNIDTFNMLLLSSDPLLTSMRVKPRKKTEPFLKETLEMLLSFDGESTNIENSSSDEEEN